MKPFPALRFHAPTRYWYYWLDRKRNHLGRDEAAARKRHAELALAYARGSQTTTLSPSLSLFVGECVQGEINSHSLSSIVTQYTAHLHALNLDRRRWNRIGPALEALNRDFGTQPVSAFGAKALRALRASLCQVRLDRDKKRPTSRTHSRTWVNHQVAEIKFLFRWAAAEELIPPAVAFAVSQVRQLRYGEGGRETDPVLPPIPGSVEAVLPHLHHPMRQLVEVLALTGMRPSEACRMRPRDISRQADQRIPLPRTRHTVAAIATASGPVWLYVPSLHKTLAKGKPRVVPLGPKAQAILQPLLDGRPADAFVFDPREVERCRRRGRRADRYTSSGVHQAVEQCIRRLNRERAKRDEPPIPDWTPYQLRHRAATDYGESHDADTAAAILGHSGMDSISRYCQQSLRKAADAAATAG